MNAEKQIKEITKDLSQIQNFGAVVIESQMDSRNSYQREIKNKDIAERLYNMGYCKQATGEWIITNNRNLEIIRECTNCHAKTYYPIELKFNCRKSRYCEDCGAKMKGGEK